MKTIRYLALSLLVLAAAACSGGSAEPTAEAAGGGGASVTMADLAYSPTATDVSAGATVTWTNNDDVPHTVTFSADGVDDSDELKQGDTFAATFAEAGTYDYVCAIHPDMKGKVTVA